MLHYKLTGSLTSLAAPIRMLDHNFIVASQVGNFHHAWKYRRTFCQKGKEQKKKSHESALEREAAHFRW